MRSRRKFLEVLGMTFTFSLASLRAFGRPPAQSSTAPQIPGQRPHNDDGLPSAPPVKGVLDANEKDIKTKIERLFELATDLKEQVQKTDSSKVLSLTIIKKSGEIEKLAHDIKSKAMG